MKLYKQSIITLIGSLLFIGCAGDSNEKTFIKKEHIMKNCNTNMFSTLYQGDKVTILLDSTELDIRHMENGSKKACVINGSAQIN